MKTNKDGSESTSFLDKHIEEQRVAWEPVRKATGVTIDDFAILQEQEELEEQVAVLMEND